MQKIAFQGELGANSHMACQKYYPDMEPMPCQTFEEALAAIADGSAKYGMIPVENSVAGRVADIHHLLPKVGLFIVGERFLPVRHQLMGIKGAKLEDVESVISHVHALGQCRDTIHQLKLKQIVGQDTAGGARWVSQQGDPKKAAIASTLAAEIYGLEIFKTDIEDAAHNTTRFLVMANEPDDAEPDEGPVMTSIIFRVRNVPAALYKGLGGFATNAVNVTKLESYQIEGSFHATQFYADIAGHPSDRSVRLALEELKFFTSQLTVLGVYPADPFREEAVESI
jgi:prephenate dehydratase